MIPSKRFIFSLIENNNNVWNKIMIYIDVFLNSKYHGSYRHHLSKTEFMVISIISPKRMDDTITVAKTNNFFIVKSLTNYSTRTQNTVHKGSHSGARTVLRKRSGGVQDECRGSGSELMRIAS